MFKLEFAWYGKEYTTDLPVLPPEGIIVSAPLRAGDVISYGMCTYQVQDVMWMISSIKNPQGTNIVTLKLKVT